uniref:Xylose isomerase-like TIM barrel domain-containing protein n=1 Tax=viral metagenome TaxID=1070528 RepID=A0A6C0LR63_9ZZZZ
MSKSKSISDLKKFREELDRNKMKLVIHGSYTINLCHPTNSKSFLTSIKSLVQDLNASSIIGERCLGVIIHMGKNIKKNGITDAEAISNYIYGLKETIMMSPKETTIILETGASQGTEVGSKLEDLSKIFWRLNEDEQLRVKFCIDTCHIYATGYDISTISNVKDFFDRFDNLIGINKIACIHYNDSKVKLGSHIDRHADIGFGFIPEIGLKEVAKIANKYKIPLIMETPLDSVNPKTNEDISFQEQLSKIKFWLKK